MSISYLAMAFTLAIASTPPASSPPATAAPPRAGLQSPAFLGFRPQVGLKGFDQSKTLGLKPLRGGGYLYQGTAQERFDARIHQDGSVEFRESGAFEVRVNSLCFSYFCPIATPKQPRVGKKKSKQDIKSSLRRTRAAKIASRVLLGALTGALPLAGMDDSGAQGPRGGSGNYYVAPPRPGSNALGIFGISGLFGRNGEVSRRKMDFLQRTRAFRLELAALAQETYTKRVLHRLPGQLQAIEQSRSQPASTRRQRLLELWEQFDVRYQEAQLQSEVLSRLNRSMGNKLRFARRQIIAFAQRVFPQGSPSAFLPQELRAFNQERSPDHRFEPYLKPNSGNTPGRPIP